MRIACIGECMLEVALGSGSVFADGARMGFGGDTLNTAVYLRRALEPSTASVHYVTALGEDPLSDAMCAAWAEEGLAVDQVQRVPGRLPGLYLIRTDRGGERSFHYWRGEAAVKSLFAGKRGAAVAAFLRDCGLVYLSGITLAVLGDDARAALHEALAAARADGARIAFDSNYRPALWSGAQAARTCYAHFAPLLDVVLPSLDDERALNDGSADDPETVAGRWRELGATEVVVKDGAGPCTVIGAGPAVTVPAAPVDTIVDTTAAGDAFNGAYLAARTRGEAPERAVRAAHRLAASVIGFRGAIVPRR